MPRIPYTRATVAATALLLTTALAASAQPDLPRLERTDAARAEGAESTFTSDLATQVSGPYTYPRDLAVSTSGRRAFALDEDRLVVLDVTRRPSPVVGRSGTVFGSDIAVRKGGKYAYVVNDQQLQVVDVSRDRPRRVRVVPTRTPNDALDAVVSPDGRWLYLSYGSGYPSGLGNGVRALSLANPARPAAGARWDTGTFPQGIAVSRSGNRVVTANALVGDVTVTNTGNPRRPRVIRKRLDLPFDVESVTMVGTTAYAYGDDGDARVAVVNAQRGRLQRVRNVQPGVEGGPDIVASGDGRYLYVTHSEQEPNPVFSVIRRSTLRSVVSFGGNADFNVSFARGLATSTRGSTSGDVFVTAGTGLGEPKGLFPFTRTN